MSNFTNSQLSLSLMMCLFFLSQAAIRKELNEFKSKEMAVHEESKQFTRYVCVLASGSKDEFKPLWETSKALHGHYRRPSVSIRFYIHNIWTLAFHWPTVHVSIWVCQPVEVEIDRSHNKHSYPVKVQKYEGSSREIQSHDRWWCHDRWSCVYHQSFCRSP